MKFAEKFAEVLFYNFFGNQRGLHALLSVLCVVIIEGVLGVVIGDIYAGVIGGALGEMHGEVAGGILGAIGKDVIV